jgi:D-alanyl-D-alanine dipeptidase
MFRICIFLFCCLLLPACENISSKGITPNTKQSNDKKEANLDSLMGAYGLIDPCALNKAIRFEMKYATTDNFLNQILYQCLNRPFLQKSVANRLAKCQERLSAYDSSLHLLIYDAVRPLDSQYKMWKALDSIPVNRRIQFVSNPSNRSLHNYGAAIDLTICDSRSNPLDMGAAFDEFDPIAFPSREEEFFIKGMLTKEQLVNRKLLWRIMISEGFSQLPSEWWHFNACSLAYAKKHFKVLLKEPGY